MELFRFPRVTALRLLGDPVRDKVAKEASSIPKSASKTSGQLHLVFFFQKQKKNKNKRALLVFEPGEPPMCLCSAPGSDSGINEGLASLFVSA